jgi:hypothetical protein
VVEKKIWYVFFSSPLCSSSLGFNNELANFQQFPATLSSTPWCKRVHESDERDSLWSAAAHAVAVSAAKHMDSHKYQLQLGGLCRSPRPLNRFNTLVFRKWLMSIKIKF